MQVQKLGRTMTLISKKEAAEYGGLSSVSESEAETVSFSDGRIMFLF